MMQNLILLVPAVLADHSATITQPRADQIAQTWMEAARQHAPEHATVENCVRFLSIAGCESEFKEPDGDSGPVGLFQVDAEYFSRPLCDYLSPWDSSASEEDKDMASSLGAICLVANGNWADNQSWVGWGSWACDVPSGHDLGPDDVDHYNQAKALAPAACQKAKASFASEPSTANKTAAFVKPKTDKSTPAPKKMPIYLKSTTKPASEKSTDTTTAKADSDKSKDVTSGDGPDVSKTITQPRANAIAKDWVHAAMKHAPDHATQDNCVRFLSISGCESEFKSDAESEGGAVGIFQVKEEWFDQPLCSYLSPWGDASSDNAKDKLCALGAICLMNDGNWVDDGSWQGWGSWRCDIASGHSGLGPDDIAHYNQANALAGAACQAALGETHTPHELKMKETIAKTTQAPNTDTTAKTTQAPNTDTTEQTKTVMV